MKQKTKRGIISSIFILIIAALIFLIYRAEFIQYSELGKVYEEIFQTNLKERTIIFISTFILTFISFYILNRGIFKGLNQFFEKEEKEMKCFPNKSIAIVIALIVAVVAQRLFAGQLLNLMNISWFGRTEPVYGLDYSYYMIAFPIIRKILLFSLVILAVKFFYIVIYYIYAINTNLEGIRIEDIADNHFLKQIRRIVLWGLIIVIALNLLSHQSILTGDMVKKEGPERIYLTGAGFTDMSIKLWGSRIITIILIIMTFRINKNIKNFKVENAVKNLVVLPISIIILFIVTTLFNLIFVNRNELDWQKKYIQKNIEATKIGHNIDLEMTEIEDAKELVLENMPNTDNNPILNNELINKIPIISENIVQKTIDGKKKETDPYIYNYTHILNNELVPVYFTPREMKQRNNATYNNKTYEYTHGNAGIVTSSTQTDKIGEVFVLEEDFTEQEIAGKKIVEPRIYYGKETDSIAIIDKNEVHEYDYPQVSGIFEKNRYEGEGGVNLNILDRIAIAITKGEPKLVFSTNNKKDSKYLINRQIIDRVKRVVPEIKYDTKPYLVPTEEGKLVWVIDGYTISDKYPYSQKIAYEDKEKGRVRINYIRNSVKVLVDAYDGTVDFYLMDEWDPLVKLIDNKYPELFKDKKDIPEDISKHFIYPSFLYEIQADALSVYHGITSDMLFRGEDIWTRTADLEDGLKSKYTILKNMNEDEKFGLVTVYTPYERQNIVSYLVGEVDNSNNALRLYRYKDNENILSVEYMKNQIRKDPQVQRELQNLQHLGTDLMSRTLYVPIEGSMLYVEGIYQVLLNETETPLLKKIIVANGNKVGIGENITSAINNLFTDVAISIDTTNYKNREALIQSIIEANNMLNQSFKMNKWEFVGKDIEKLTTLIDQLEKLEKQSKALQTQLENKETKKTEKNTKEK